MIIRLYSRTGGIGLVPSPSSCNRIQWGDDQCNLPILNRLIKFNLQPADLRVIVDHASLFDSIENRFEHVVQVTFSPVRRPDRDLNLYRTIRETLSTVHKRVHDPC